MRTVSKSELIARAALLTELAASVSPANVPAVLSAATDALGEIPGDPDGLEDLSVAFRRAGTGMGTVAEDTRLTGTSRLRQAWTSGVAADTAASTTTAAGDAVRDGAEPFGFVADAMDTLASKIRSLQAEHGDVCQAMIDAMHRATQVAAQPNADPAAGADAAKATPRPRPR